MAAYAENKPTARMPRLLKDAFLSERWGLPYAGGWKDEPNWPASEQMAKVLNIYHAVKSWKSARDWVKWVNAHPVEWQTVQAVIRLRRMYGFTKPT